MLSRLTRTIRRLREGADAAIATERHVRAMLTDRLWSEVKSSPRYSDPKRLLAKGYKAFSQGNEDGMIEEVFRRIGTSNRRFIEFGVEDGLECNSALLLVTGWSGAWIEASSANARKARTHYASYGVAVEEAMVTPELADAQMLRLSGGPELDLLSIDIDGNDYWVWKSITSIRPRLVVIEYNATLPPHISKVMAPNPTHRWDGTNYGGASLKALERLGAEKGYCLVGCTPAGVNAFFVRRDLVGDHFCAPFTAENHYEPPRYDLSSPAGHRPGMGPWIDA